MAAIPFQPMMESRPIYRANCNYGHFGKADMPWEQLDYVNALRREILE